MKRAFLFDMDGVIVDSNPAHKVALKQFCKQHGQELSEEQLREKIYGRTNRDWLKALFGEIDEKTLQQYAQEKEALYRKIYEKEIKPLPGLTSFLEKMDGLNIARAVATSAPRANVDFTLSKTNIEKYFTVILDDTFVSRGKPDPEIYIKSAAALGYDPVDCIVFEDSLSGVQAGKSAGCKVVGVSTTHTRQELKDTDFVIDDFINLDPEVLIHQLFERV